MNSSLVQVNFVGFSWEDAQNPIASLVLFVPTAMDQDVAATGQDVK